MMEKFKQKIKLQRTAAVCVLLLSLIASAIVYIATAGSTTHLNSFTRGIQTGAFLGISIFLIFVISMFTKALRNDDYLRQKYIKYSDERSQQVKEKTYATSLAIFSILLCLALVISGFFNQIVFLTILAVIGFLILLVALNNLYFNKHY